MSAARVLGEPGGRQPRPQLVWALVGLLAGAAPLRADTINRIVAIVNDEVITEADVEAHLGSLLETGQGRPADLGAGELRQAVLRRLIEQQVILQEARREGVVISPEEIAKQLDELRGRFESEEAFQQSLAEAQLSTEQLKEQLRRQLMVQRILEAERAWPAMPSMGAAGVNVETVLEKAVATASPFRARTRNA